MGSRSSSVDEGRAQARVRAEADRTGLRKVLFNLRYRRRRYRQLVGVALVFLFTLLGTPTATWWLVGAVFACLGMTVRVWASGFVMKDEVLATSGPYGFVRHPLYVGNLLICLGFCLASGLWWSWVVSLAFLLYFYPQTIRDEDAKLRRLFPEVWDEWAAGTRALIPRRSPYSRRQEGAGWRISRSLKRNGEPLHVVVLGGCLVYLWLLTR